MGEVQSANNASFQILPELKNKFRAKLLQEVIHNCLVDQLSDFVYTSVAADAKASDLSAAVRNKIIELNLPHYKYAVHVVIGEQRGEGIKVAARCLWDSDSDGHVIDNYITDAFFCNVAVFGLYLY